MDRLRQEALAALKAPADLERLEMDGAFPAANVTVKQFQAQITREIANWDSVVKRGKLQVN